MIAVFGRIRRIIGKYWSVDRKADATMVTGSKTMVRSAHDEGGDRLATPGRKSPDTPESLAELLTRLSGHREVTGIVLGGSHAAGRQTAWSDLDLLLVLRGPDLPFTLATTTVGGTLTEIVCCTAEDIHDARRGAPPAHWDRATYIRFLGGRILFDRDGSLAQAAAWAAAQPEPGPDVDPFSRWRHAQYNVRQTRRYLASGDEAARTAVVARMLYSLHDILRDYFTMREMAWPGDKEALAYWRDHEPELRRVWLAAVAETEIDRKIEAWVAMFPLVYARFRGLAGPEIDLIQPADGTTVEQAYVTWKTLINDASD